MLLLTLEAMMQTVKLMKGKAGDALYFRRDSQNGEMYAYLIVGNNYVRYTKDTVVPAYDDYEGEVILVDVLIYLLNLPSEVERIAAYKNIRIQGRGMLVYGKTSTSSYVADKRYLEYMTLMKSIFDYMVPNNCSYALYRDFDETPQWEVYKNLKASDGAKYICVDNAYTMYLFGGLIPIVKDDKVDLHILDNANYRYFMANFEVTKWKTTKKETKRVYTYNCIVCFFKI